MTQDLLTAADAAQQPAPQLAASMPVEGDALDFSFLGQSQNMPAPAVPAQEGQHPVTSAPRTAREDADALDFSFLESAPAPATVTVDDAAIAAQSLNAASRYSRQQIMEARNNARVLGISFEEALTHGPSASTIARQASVEDVRQFSPRLVAALQGRAAYAERDDLPHLDTVATAFDGISLSEEDMDAALTAPRAHGRISQRMQEGAQQMGDALRGSMLGLLEGYLADTRREVETNAKFSGYDYESDPYYSGVKGLVDRWKESARDNAPQRVASLPPADTVLGRYTEAVAQMAPQVLGQIVSYVMGGRALSTAFMASQITGGTYNELTDKGVDADKALYASLGNMLAQVPLEQLSLEKSLAIFKTSGAWNTLKALLGSAATEATTEFLQAYPEAIAEIWATTDQQGGNFEQGLKEFVDKFGEITVQGLYEGAVAAPYGAFFGGLGMARNGKAAKAEGDIPGLASAPDLLGNLPAELAETLRGEARQLTTMQQRQHFGEALDKAAAHIDASKTTAQDPEAMAEIVQELIPEDFREAWIGAEDAAVLYQSAVQRDSASVIPGTEAEALLTALGTDVDGLQAAAALGAPLPLPTASALTLFQGASRATLLDALRPTADGVSGAEAKAFDPKARMDAALESVRSSQRIRSEVNSEISRITRELGDIKKDDGKRLYPEHVVKDNVALHSQQVLAFAASYGQDPVTLLRRRVFSHAREDAQARHRASLFQESAPVDIDATRLGIAEHADIKEYISAGKIFHDELREESKTKPIIHKQLQKNVRLSGKGWKKNKDSGAQKEKWLLFPYLREIIENSTIVHTKETSKPRKDGFVRFHFAQTPVSMSGQTYLAGVTLAEDVDGNLFYNVRLDNENGEVPTNLPSQPKPGEGELRQDGSNVSEDSAEVNISLENADATVPRGYSVIAPEQAAVFFTDKADLSTIAHESMHIFLDDLMTVAADDGSIALANMQRRVEATLHSRGMAVESVAAVREAMQTVLGAAPNATPNATPDQRLTALHALRESLKLMVQDARANAHNADAAVKAMQQQQAQHQQQGGQPLDIGVLPPWTELQTAAFHARQDASAATTAVNAVSVAMRHVHGLEKARHDVRALRRFAKVAEEGDLSREDWRTLHETTAQAFEVYLSEGKAPSVELKSVFSRMRAWLLGLWKQFKENRPTVELNDTVRRVFDRMLATDKQLGQSRELGDVLRAEDQFLESAQLTADEWRELTDLRNEAEAEVTAAMDRATLRQRAKRRTDHLKAAQQALADDPFWLAVDNLSARVKDAADPAAPSRGGLDRDSVARLIGQPQTAELSRRRPGLINAQGHGLPADIAAMEYGQDLGLAEDEDAFVTLLYDRLVTQGESRRKLAERMADQAMEEEDSHAAAMSLENATEAYAAYLDKVDAVVLRRMAQKKYRSEREQQRFVDNSMVPRVRIQQMAADEIMHTPLHLVSPARYQAMLDKALRDRAAFVRSDDVVKALDAVERARLANELRGRAADVLARRDATLALAARLASAKPGTMPTVQRAALRKVLGLYNLGRVPMAADSGLHLASLSDLVRQMLGETADGVMPSFPSWILDGTHPETGAVISGALDYSKLTPVQLQHVHDMLKFLQKSAFDQRTDNAKAEAARLNTIVRQTSEAMAGLEDMQLAEAGTLRRYVQDKLRGIYGAVDALRWQMRKADGLVNVMGKDGSTKGAAESGLLDPAVKGEQRARERTAHVAALMAPHLVQLADSVKAWEAQYGKNLMLKDKQGKPVLLPQAIQKAHGRKQWTADNVIALALNVGNTSNLRRITSFYKDLDHSTVAALLGDAVADRIFGTRTVVDAHAPQGLLSLKDWQAIQGIWDALASQWADTQAVHERMFGFKPQGVDARPLILVDNRTGQHVALAGGYYPVRYDPQISDRVAQWGEQEDILSRNDSLFAVPSAKRGHTKAREENTPELPIRLDTGILMEHINDAVRYIELGEITRFADKVTQHAAFRSEYIRAFGRADYEAIRPNLRGLVRTDPPPKNEIVKLANSVRKYLVPWGLAWNFKVAALQLTAIFPAMGDMGVMPVLHGMAWLGKNGMQGMRAIWDASPYMKSRLENIDQDLQRNVANFNPAKRPASVTVAGREFTWESVVEAGMLPIVAVDAMATGSVWLGAYAQKLAELEGGSPTAANGATRDATRGAGIHAASPYHQEAVDYADGMVKQGNPDFDASSRSGFLRANDTYRLINNFASAVTLFAQRHRYMYTAHSKGTITLGQLARFEAFDTILPAVAVFLLLALARGYLGDDDEEGGGLLKLFMSTSFDFVSMRLPIFGGLLGDAALSMLGMGDGGGAAGRGGIRTALDAPVDFVGNLSGRAGKALWQEGDISEDQAKRLVYGAADIASFWLRVPFSKKIRDAERGYHQWQRGEGTPFSVIMPRPGK